MAVAAVLPAAEAVALLTAVAARHMVVGVAVPTVIDKISASQEGPTPTSEAGLFFFRLPQQNEKPVHNSLFARVFNG
jgi:hypothetical protein